MKRVVQIISLLAFAASAAQAATYYVSPGGDDGDGLSWETAKKNIQSAIDLAKAKAGDEVVVADGVYTPIKTDNNAITIRSVNGAEKTIIDGGGTNRCATLGWEKSKVILIGFTLKNGQPRSGTGAGGGVSYGTVYDCTITENTAQLGGGGGGAWLSVLINCTLSKNMATSEYGHGGGAWDCALTNCVLVGNVAQRGGGSHGGTLDDCTLSENTALSYGGGSARGVLNNCKIVGNTAKERGGGSWDSTLNNCTLTKNKAPQGGGVYGNDPLVNCVLSENEAEQDGGGACWAGPLIKCTLERNTAQCGGAAFESELIDCIVQGNVSRDGGEEVYHKERRIQPRRANARENERTPTPDAKADATLPNKELYLIVDLSGGANAESYPVRYSATPPDLGDDTCRTTEMWFRLIPKGKFIMGCSSDEFGWFGETQRKVTLSQPFYIGVFEVTQKQWELVMGKNPTSFSEWRGDVRPATDVSYDMIRGATNSTPAINWPKTRYAVEPSSFMGVLRKKTGLTFDLPTEAQWEYACRAGTTTSLNSGKNVMNDRKCLNMDEVGRYCGNHYDGKGGFHDPRQSGLSNHTKVGMYKPNAWGLYDMHGNVQEGCLDWWQKGLGTSAVTDPKGAANAPKETHRPVHTPSGREIVRPYGRIVRGGDYANGAVHCDSARRSEHPPGNKTNQLGLRAVILPSSTK